MKKRIFSASIVIGALVIQGCAINTGANLEDLVVASGKRIFGSFQTPSLGGASGADAACQADSGKPGTGTYKALLTSSSRRACTNSNCSSGNEGLDWVLAANTKYIQHDTNKEIFTTNANRIFIFGTMNNIFAQPSYNYSKFMTGLTATWQSDANNCSNWSTTSSGQNMAYGSGDKTTSAAIAAGVQNCNSINYIICVEQ